MLTAVLEDSTIAAAVGSDKRFLIDDLGQAHKCYYRSEDWSKDDVAIFELNIGCEINSSSEKFNVPVDVELYQVPIHLKRQEIRSYYEYLSDWPEPVKTFRLYPAPVV